MSAAQKTDADPLARLFTWREYLDFEERSETRHEFMPFTQQYAGGPALGKLVAMAGATREHNCVATNISRELGNAFKEKDCIDYQADMKVRLPDGRGVYPDVVVTCGEEEFEERELDEDGNPKSPLVLLNPVVVVEVLSETTSDYDRGDKFRAYRDLDCLREYHLVSPDGRASDRFVRNVTGWKIESVTAADAALPFETLGVEIPMSEVYRNVRLFEETPPGAE